VITARSVLLRGVRAGSVLLALSVSLPACSSTATSSLTPLVTATNGSTFSVGVPSTHTRTPRLVNQDTPPPDDPCLENPSSCSGVNCDASQETCGGTDYPPPSGGGGGVSAPAPSEPSNRAKTPAERACNAAGGVFFTDTGGNTNCQKPGMSGSVYGPTGCPLYGVLLKTNGIGGTVYFPPELGRDPVSFGSGGGVAFEPGCAFTVYNGVAS
jgi:hypothetical protein